MTSSQALRNASTSAAMAAGISKGGVSFGTHKNPGEVPDRRRHRPC